MLGLCLNLSVCPPKPSLLCIYLILRMYFKYPAALLVGSPSQILDLKRSNLVKYRFNEKKKEKVNSLRPCFYYEPY